MADILSIRLPVALQRSLARLCRTQRRAASDIAREAIRRYLASQELQEIRDRMRPAAEAKGLLTDEDVFRAVS